MWRSRNLQESYSRLDQHSGSVLDNLMDNITEKILVKKLVMDMLKAYMYKKKLIYYSGDVIWPKSKMVDTILVYVFCHSMTKTTFWFELKSLISFR